jgi:hypothetical protein
MVMEACKAVARDPHRAACIETLAIRFSRLSSFNLLLRRPMRRLAEALAAVPNLKTLRIQSWSYHTEHLAKMLCSPTSGRGHPFHLNAFTCMGVLHDVIDPFIRSQSAITDYSIDGDTAYPDEKNKVDDCSEAELGRARRLPNIRRFRGPSHYVHRILNGGSVDILEVTASAVDDDIQALYDNFYRFPRAKRDEIAAGDGRRTIARNVCMNLWTSAEEHHHFPYLISISYQVSLSHIRSLKLQSWAMLNRDTVPPTLKLFRVLEYFEWDSLDYILEIGADWITKFVLDCAENAPHLHRITFSNTRCLHIYRIWSRVPVDTLTPDDDAVPCVVTKEHPAASQVTLLSTSSVVEALTKMAPIREGLSFAWKMETLHADYDAPDIHWQTSS